MGLGASVCLSGEGEERSRHLWSLPAASTGQNHRVPSSYTPPALVYPFEKYVFIHCIYIYIYAQIFLPPPPNCSFSNYVPKPRKGERRLGGCGVGGGSQLLHRPRDQEENLKGLLQGRFLPLRISPPSGTFEVAHLSTPQEAEAYRIIPPAVDSEGSGLNYRSDQRG